MSSNISSTTMQSWRERPPSSYSIKVKNLSELESSTLHSDGKYMSRRFSSGDYKWYVGFIYSLSVITNPIDLHLASFNNIFE